MSRLNLGTSSASASEPLSNTMHSDRWSDTKRVYPFLGSRSEDRGASRESKEREFGFTRSLFLVPRSSSIIHSHRRSKEFTPAHKCEVVCAAARIRPKR